MTPTLKEYLTNLTNAINANAGNLFNPEGGYLYGADGAYRLARETGQALSIYDDAEVRKEIGSLYSTLLVKHTFGTRLGVPISNKQFIGELNRARDEEKHRHCERLGRLG